MALSGNAVSLSVTTSTGRLPTLHADTRLLVVAPHPDDETIATGLLIQQVRAAGGQVRIVLLTPGDNNPWPQRWLERRLRIGATDRQRWGARRHAEMLRALECLDVPAQALHALGWPDMGLTEALLRADGKMAAMLAATIREFRPSLLAMPALGDHHPDHGSAHVLTRLALADQPESPAVLSYLIHGQAPDSAVIELDGTTAQVANKFSALAAHRSQMALSGGRMRRLAARPERFVEPVAARSEGATSPLPWRPPALLWPWLRLSLVSAAATQSWRWPDAPLQRDARGNFQLIPPAGTAGPRFARLELDLPALWIFDHWGWCEL